jgi:hypothetical protein
VYLVFHLAILHELHLLLPLNDQIEIIVWYLRPNYQSQKMNYQKSLILRLNVQDAVT